MSKPRRGSSRSPKRSHSAFPLVVGSLIVGAIIIHWLAGRARQLARTDWHDVPELRGVSLAQLQLSNGQTLALHGDDSAPGAHVVYLFQYDCAACDAQRAHVAELLEAIPASQVVSATAQPGSLSPGYWGDLGSPLPQPLGADSSWLAERHLDHLPMVLFVGPSGKVSKAIQGSVLTWSEHAFVEAFRAAGST
jgi:hypothetical protein